MLGAVCLIIVAGVVGATSLPYLRRIPEVDATPANQDSRSAALRSEESAFSDTDLEFIDGAAQLTETLDVNRIDLHKADWPSEIFNDEASKQLTVLGHLLEHPAELTADASRKLVPDDFTCNALRPPNLDVVYDNAGILVKRPSTEPSRRFGGVDGFLAAMRELVAPLEDGGEVHVKFKIVNVEAGTDRGTTTVLVQISGNQTGLFTQQNALWECAWQRQPTGQPLLLSIDSDARAYEEAAHRDATQQLFTDATEAVLGGNRCFYDQLAPGTNYWLARLETAIGVDLVGANGVAVGDVNGDGRDDVYVCQPGGMPNRLFIANSDGTAADRAADFGVDFMDVCGHALLLDLDNDGDKDLVVIMVNDITFFELDEGRFHRRDSHVVRSGPEALNAADYDLDGLLDVYVVNHDSENADHGVFGMPVPYYDAKNGGRNALLRNLGGMRFEDVTEQTGLDQNNTRFSLAAAWDDYDQDGDPDLYVANDFGRNNLYRNDNGRFVDVAADEGVEDISAGMSASWGDYNNDGRLDLYVSNMFSSAGNRVTYQRKFSADRDSQLVEDLRRHARGNSLFENSGDGSFRDVSVETNVTMGRWAWASTFADVNNDGWQDLLISNGFITNEDVDDL